MIKAKSGNRVFLGLSDDNMKRLSANDPIMFNLKELGMQDITIIIFNGSTEDEMAKIFKEHIDPLKTIIQDYRAPKN